MDTFTNTLMIGAQVVALNTPQMANFADTTISIEATQEFIQDLIAEKEALKEAGTLQSSVLEINLKIEGQIIQIKINELNAGPFTVVSEISDVDLLRSFGIEIDNPKQLSIQNLSSIIDILTIKNVEEPFFSASSNSISRTINLIPDPELFVLTKDDVPSGAQFKRSAVIGLDNIYFTEQIIVYGVSSAGEFLTFAEKKTIKSIVAGKESVHNYIVLPSAVSYPMTDTIERYEYLKHDLLRIPNTDPQK